MKTNLHRFATLAAIAFAAALPAQAVPITVSFSGSASGSLDGEDFGTTAYTITGLAKSEDAYFSATGSRYLPFTSSFIVLEGFGAFSFLSPLGTVSGEFASGKLQIALARFPNGYLRISSVLGFEWDGVSPFAHADQEAWITPGWSNTLESSEMRTDAGLIIFNPHYAPVTVTTLDGWHPPTSPGPAVPDTGHTLLLLGTSLLGVFTLSRKCMEKPVRIADRER